MTFSRDVKAESNENESKSSENRTPSAIRNPARKVKTAAAASATDTGFRIGALGNSVAQTQAASSTAQLYSSGGSVNKTGLSDNLKSGIESLSGLSMDNVRVHYNSNKPAQLNAHAYTQGTDIHVAPGQKKHVAHEAWHVVQQMQGRVKPTMETSSGVKINDSKSLEKEADVMGAKAQRPV